MAKSLRCGVSSDARRRRIRHTSVALLAGSMLVFVAACGGSSSGSKASGGAAAGAYKVGIIQFASSDPYSSAILRGIETYANDQGWHPNVVDSGGDVSKALAAMTNLVQQKVDVIITATYPPKSLQGGIAQAKAAGIPVVSVIGTGEVPGLVGYYDIGTPQGAAVAKQMETDLVGKKVNLLEIDYSPGSGCQAEGVERDKWKATAHIVKTRQEEVPIPGQVEAARGFTASWLQGSPQVPGIQNVIWACWDDPALGAVAALRAAGRRDVLLYGATGEKAAILAIRDGWMTGDAYTDPKALGDAVGKALPGFIKDGVNVKTQAFGAPTVAVTRDDVNDFIKHYPAGVK